MKCCGVIFVVPRGILGVLLFFALPGDFLTVQAGCCFQLPYGSLVAWADQGWWLGTRPASFWMALGFFPCNFAELEAECWRVHCLYTWVRLWTLIGSFLRHVEEVCVCHRSVRFVLSTLCLFQYLEIGYSYFSIYRVLCIVPCASPENIGWGLSDGSNSRDVLLHLFCL